jgi:hypothetical protein
MLLSDAKDVRIGDVQAKAMYAGDVLVWSSTPPFQPTTIPGLLFWLDATSLAANDGDPVTTWPDSSGNGLTGVGGGLLRGALPTYQAGVLNGKPGVRFGASVLTECTVVIPRPVGARTVFQVVRTAGVQIGTWHTTQLQEFDPYIQTYGGPTVHTYGDRDIDSGIPWSGVVQYVTVWTDDIAGTQGLDVDGIARVDPWTPAAAQARWFVGGLSPAGYGLNGWIGELLVYEWCLSPAERKQVQDYLRQKWGLP